MTKTARFSILVAMLVLLCSHVVLATSDSSAQDIYTTLRNLERSSKDLQDSEKANKFAQIFDGFLGKNKSLSQLRSYSDIDLIAIFNASDLATFYTFEPKYALFMKDVLIELSRRNLATPQQWDYLYGAFIQSRMFSQALELRSIHRLQKNLPVLILTTTNTPYVWVPDESENKLILQSPSIPKGPSILVLAHPLCHFTQNAVRDIENTPRLRAIFESNAKLLVPPSRTFDVNAVQDWNRNHPNFKMEFIFSREQWPNFKYWETPIFYFMRDGEVVETVTGWPEEGHIDELILAMHKIGL